jgi:phosphohistidine phosphatase
MEPCDLYIVRHAIAAERGDEWPDDSKRPLTEEGINKFKEVVEGLSRLDVEIDEIFTSPLVRAKQTATLLAHGLGNKTSVKTLEALAPGHSPRQVMNE